MIKLRNIRYPRFLFFYGWVIFLVTLLTYMVMYGLRYSIGIFFVPFQQEFGWTAAMTTGAVSLFFWVYGLSGSFIGRLINAIGVRKTLALGGFLLGFSGALLSLMYEIWHLYFLWGVTASIGAAILYITPTMILTRFFYKKRGKVVGWSSIGISLGQAILVPFVGWLIVRYGWRTAFIFPSVLVLAVSVVGYVLFRDSPESIGLKVDGDDPEPTKTPIFTSKKEHWTPKEAIRTTSFAYISVSYFFMVGGVLSLLTFVVPHIIYLGIDPLLAASAFGVIGIMSAIGSFLFGIISDRIGRRSTIFVTSFGIALSMFSVVIIPANLIALYAWVTVYGLTYGGVPEQYPAIIADYFGARHGATLFGYIHLFGGIGGGVIPLIGAYMFDITGNYYCTILFLGVCLSVASAFILLSKFPSTNSKKSKRLRYF